MATLTMDQPHNRNALTPALMAGLAEGLESALADEAVGVVVLTNSGPAFCAGADLSGGSPAGPAGSKRRSGARRDGLADLLAAIQDSAKPVVARIAGHCVAGGIGLAAACDISIAGRRGEVRLHRGPHRGRAGHHLGRLPAQTAPRGRPRTVPLRRADQRRPGRRGRPDHPGRARGRPRRRGRRGGGQAAGRRPVGPRRGETAGLHDPGDGPGRRRSPAPPRSPRPCSPRPRPPREWPPSGRSGSRPGPRPPSPDLRCSGARKKLFRMVSISAARLRRGGDRRSRAVPGPCSRRTP